MPERFPCRDVIVNQLYPDSKGHGANMGPIWGRQDPSGPHVGPMNFATWVHIRLIVDNVRLGNYQIVICFNAVYVSTINNKSIPFYKNLLPIEYVALGYRHMSTMAFCVSETVILTVFRLVQEDNKKLSKLRITSPLCRISIWKQ